jgi:hypothetical protein
LFALGFRISAALKREHIISLAPWTSVGFQTSKHWQEKVYP